MEAATLTMGSLPGPRLQTTRCDALRIFGGRVHVRRNSPRCARMRVMCTASTAVHFTEKFDSTQQEQWRTSRKLVEDLGFTGEEADDVLAKSFGWSYSDYWGEEKQATIPDPETISASVAVVSAIPGVDMAALVKKFPEVIGLSQQEVQYSLGTLDSTWGIAGKALKGVVNRNPQVLGFNFDCGGDCAGECTRCWVRF